MSNKRLYFVFLICIAMFTVVHVHKTFQNDTFFTIPIGNYIIENGINEDEPLTFHEDLKFTKLRWAFDITVSSIYNQFGFMGLYVFTVAMSMLFSCTLFSIICKLTNSEIRAFILSLITVLFVSENLVCRAQIVSYTLFILEFYFLNMLINTGKNKYCVMLGALSYILLAFHSSVWIIYLVLFAPFYAEWFIKAVTNNRFMRIKNKILVKDIPLKKLTIAFIIVLVSGLITPLGLSPYTYSIKSFGSLASSFVIELLPVDVFESPSIIIFSIILLILVVIPKVKIRMSDLCYAIGLIIMPFIAERNLYISLPILAIVICKLMDSFIENYGFKSCLESFEKYLNEKIYANVLFVILVVTYVFFEYKKISIEEYIDETQYPVQATEYILKNLNTDNIRLYTGFDYGSYLEYKGIKPFIDSRSEIYCEEFNHVTILQDWNCLYYGDEEELDEILQENIVEKYKLTHILCYADDYWIDYMNDSDNYEEIYSDDFFKIFEVTLKANN